ncbi:MAG: hypothetical protein K8T91_20230 [Planctomycetes bacterium]|nr:hypothetical protein [Planctomycetota bacterium]
MPIRFACPHCGQSLRARDDKVGRKLKCPKCQKTLTVPADVPSSVSEERTSGSSDDAMSELIVYEDETIEETEAAPRSPAPPSRPPSLAAVQGGHVAVPRWMFYVHAALLALVAGVAFTAGWLIGGGKKEDVNSTITAAPQRPVEIAGHLKWKAAMGETGDKDAVVIVLPIGRTPPKKIPTATLLVDKPALKPDDPAYQAILELGGFYVRAGEGGQFFLQLMPGKYRVLLVSRNAQLQAGVNRKPEDVAELGTIFTPPEAILGRQKYQFSTMELDAKSKIDHSFGESGK